MERIRIEKGTVQETLLIPLYARRLCSMRFASLYRDPEAVRICDGLDYDFSELDKKANTTAYEFGALEGAMRQLDMMWEINDYLKDHPKASIVCLGCGLDLDPRRCGGKDNKIYNLDFPDTIKAREQLAGIDEREVNIPGDINSLEWMDRIDAAAELTPWSRQITVGVRDYMLGYYDMKNPEVKGVHRFLAKIADKWLGMKIVRIQFNEQPLTK